MQKEKERIVNVSCKLHGDVPIVLALDSNVPPRALSCPYCLRTMRGGKQMCGEGYLDTRGVAYVVDVGGNLRKMDDLRPDQVEKILGRRKLLRGKQ